MLSLDEYHQFLSLARGGNFFKAALLSARGIRPISGVNDIRLLHAVTFRTAECLYIMKKPEVALFLCKAYFVFESYISTFIQDYEAKNDCYIDERDFVEELAGYCRYGWNERYAKCLIDRYVENDYYGLRDEVILETGRDIIDKVMEKVAKMNDDAVNFETTVILLMQEVSKEIFRAIDEIEEEQQL